jgi:hypothetical protein
MSMDPMLPRTLGPPPRLAGSLERRPGVAVTACTHDDVPADEAGVAAHWSEGRRLARAVRQELVTGGQGDIMACSGRREAELD